jgi:hypothetical protein
MTGVKIHIHEDSWGMRSLYPAAASADVLDDLRQAAAAGIANRDPSGVGFTDIYVIQPPKLKFADIGLPLTTIKVALAGIMPVVSEFNATIGGAIGRAERDPYGSYDAEPHCFGYGPDCFIKIEATNDFVSEIWFEAQSSDPARLGALRTALLAVNSVTPVVIADYCIDAGGHVGDAAFLDAYFKEISG